MPATITTLTLGLAITGPAVAESEEHLRVALTGSQGDLSVFITLPFSTLFLALSVLSVAWSLWAALRPEAGAARR